MPIVRILAADSDSCANFAWFVSNFPNPYKGHILDRQQRAQRHGRRKRLFFLTTMLVSLEASTATDVRANRFIPSVFDVIHFLSGAMSLYKNVVFNSYGTALFVSNKAEYGGEIREMEEKQVPIRFFDMSRGFGIRHARIWPLMGTNNAACCSIPTHESMSWLKLHTEIITDRCVWLLALSGLCHCAVRANLRAPPREDFVWLSCVFSRV